MQKGSEKMFDLLDRFFEASNLPMTPPPAYGWFHILYTIIGFTVCGVIAWKIRKINDNAAKWFIFSIGLFLGLTEVYKQLFLYFNSENHTYNWGELPFQLCSVPLYLCLIAPWLKPGKIQRGMYSFMVLFNLLGGGISFLEPSGLLLHDWFSTIHALLWHTSLVFLGLFLCFSQRGATHKKDYFGAAITFIALCAFAFLINTLVQNLLGKHINMFFVGPGESPIIVFKQFCRWFGWPINTLIYIFAVCLGAYLLHLLILMIIKKKKA